MKRLFFVVMLAVVHLLSPAAFADKLYCSGTVRTVGVQLDGWLIITFRLTGGGDKVVWLCRVGQDTVISEPPPAVTIGAPTCKAYKEILQLAYAMNSTVVIDFIDRPAGEQCSQLPSSGALKTGYIYAQ